jgi:feruloyl esterase
MRFLMVVAFFPAIVIAQGGGSVQFRDWNPPAPDAKAIAACGQLLSLTGFDLSVISARLAPASATAPEHCNVFLMAQPEINIEVNLPTAWNGRFYMFGNGGWAGESFDAAGRVANHARALRKGFATASTDTGHSAAEEPGASFARNRQKLLDFGFRSLHVTAEAAKLLIRTYYGAGPSRSYFDGCSQGGREALTIAQRFPGDFDGILAGSPALYNTGNMIARAYWMRGMETNPFPAAKLGLLADRVYGKCDEKDGLKDGVIDSPLSCGFDATKDLPRCEAGKDSRDCFTDSEIASADRIYRDVFRQGKRFFPGWPPGAEVAGPNGQSGWLGQEVAAPGRGSVWANYAQAFLQYMATPERDGGDAIPDFDIDKDIPRLQFLHEVIDATDPDLSAFRNRGGKLIMYFGWADPQLNPRVAVEYYEDVEKRMGDGTGSFFRLFMVPGMFHCGGGVGTSTFDAATPLLHWVEAGKAPDTIPASRVSNGSVNRTRPLCPYPQVARYTGSGGIDDADSFRCAAPR